MDSSGKLCAYYNKPYLTHYDENMCYYDGDGYIVLAEFDYDGDVRESLIKV